MKLTLKRLDTQGRYETMILRHDGVCFTLRGPDCTFALPHDIAHYIVEKALRLEDGFWGRVAAGGVFPSMTYVEGRRRPKAAERSKDVLKANPNALSEAEVLVRIFCEGIEEGHDEKGPILAHRLKERRGADGRPINSEQIAAVMAQYRTLRTRWRDLPVGSAIELEW